MATIVLPVMLNDMGGVPVQRVEEHSGLVDNRATCDRLFESLESGVSIGIFPEDVSHAASQMTRLNTGATRIALAVAARRRVPSPQLLRDAPDPRGAGAAARFHARPAAGRALGHEVGALRREREGLVARICAAADEHADPAQPRFFREPR